MLFNSYVFILLFLPIAVAGYYLAAKLPDARAPVLWLIVTSLFFYGWWNPAYLGLISVSIALNYLCGRWIQQSDTSLPVTLGVLFNVGLLVFYKYTNFLVDNINTIADTDIHVKTIILPLAISFFTFQQISYLVDTHKGHVKEHSFSNYCLFVTFFPQLIAGPIVHHSEMLPQFSDSHRRATIARNIAIGLSIFAVGLFKKVIIADQMALQATPVFAAADSGLSISMFEAWGGVLAYTLQIYFDFSGYSDMAIGLARLFGIQLPLNFDSPYKAASIIDFWRRWHMTLSRFLRDYIYIPLGGNRNGPTRRYVNLMTVMLVGGMWHGAGWNFLIWGALHGAYLVINHGWNFCKGRLLSTAALNSAIYHSFAVLVTFLAVMIAWVFFRAETTSGAWLLLANMTDLSAIVLPVSLSSVGNTLSPALQALGITVNYSNASALMPSIGMAGAMLLALLAAWLLPNTQQLFIDADPTIERPGNTVEPHAISALRFSFNARSACFVAVALLYPLSKMTGISEFLYFQF